MSSRGLHIYTHEFFPKRGGIASYCHEFALAAIDLDYRVTVHGPKSACDMGPSAMPYTLNPGRASGTHGWASIGATRQLLSQRLAKYRNDTHLFAEPGPLLALGTLPRTVVEGARKIAVLHGSEILRWRRPSLRGWFGCRALGEVSSIRCVSTAIGDLALKSFPDLAPKITVVRNALPAQFLIQETGISPQIPSARTVHLLSVGRIHPRKGFDQVLRALGRLEPEKKSKIRYTIAGGSKSGRYLRKLQDLAKSLQVELSLCLDLNDEALAECYRSADIFLLTSLACRNSIEGFGLVYLEAGAFGLPCIGYDTGGVKDAIRDGETGLLVAPGDIEGLACAIRDLTDDPVRRAQIGHNNRAFATARNWRDVVAETLQSTA